jgi:hypothetical protein
MPESDLQRPLVSCILPTFDRRGFLPHALHYFLRQDYPLAELLVVDDGTDPVGDLMPDHPRIRYLRLPKRVTLGAKLNLACERVAGGLIAQWDDDDWYAPWRLSRQVDALLVTGAQVSGINDLIYYDLQGRRGYRYRYPRDERPWLLGSSLCFRRELWQSQRFADVDVGMDGIFVWATPPHLVTAIADPNFAVHMIHSRNVSPKNPQGAWWSDFPVTEIARTIGDDWPLYESIGEPLTCPRPRPSILPRAITTVEVAPVVAPPPVIAPPRPTTRSLRNVYACLVHEAGDCVVDLVRNLRCLDPESPILLYNGGDDRDLLAREPALEPLGALVHPRPRPMRWGRLHEFALDCMRFAFDDLPFDTMTIVDSDQLALRPEWGARLGEYLAEQGSGVGLLGNQPERQGPGTAGSAAMTAWQEYHLWQPFLRRFPEGENKFVHWTFWPSTVFTADAAEGLLALFDHDQQLADILSRSQLWATEEILFPTLTALLGFRVIASPGHYQYVNYRVHYGPRELQAALGDEGACWIHPVPRHFDDPLRRMIREHFDSYHGQAAGAAPARPGGAWLTDEIRLAALADMRPVRGWLADNEAELLITIGAEALVRATTEPAVVEIGSFCGKATVVLGHLLRAMRPDGRVWAIDPHDGVVGAAGQGLREEGPTLAEFQLTMSRSGLSAFVETVQARSADVAWSRPICLLLVDGLHDYDSVARDFKHFEKHLTASALIAFHDYADYFPGVRSFVDELLAAGQYSIAYRAGSLIVLQSRSHHPPSIDRPPGITVLETSRVWFQRAL